VVGSTGRLTGYAGGLAAKRKLLDHERGVSSWDGVPLSR
jgi:methylated-DNA-[protein]-cysteine S-methyltransferase